MPSGRGRSHGLISLETPAASDDGEAGPYHVTVRLIASQKTQRRYVVAAAGGQSYYWDVIALTSSSSGGISFDVWYSDGRHLLAGSNYVSSLPRVVSCILQHCSSLSRPRRSASLPPRVQCPTYGSCSAAR